MKYDNEELYDLFKQYGVIDASKVSKTVKKEDNKLICESNGYGFVKFNDKEKAQEIVDKIKLDDPNIVIESYLKERKKAAPNNLYIRNFSTDVDEDTLKTIFEKYGEITSVKVMSDENSGRKFGYVCFKEEDAATAALEMHESAIEPYSDNLYVQRHEKKSVRRSLLQNQYKKQNLFVRNFSEDVNEKDLYDLFNQYGPVKNVRILMKKSEIDGDVRNISK